MPAPLRPSTPTAGFAVVETERRLRVAQDHFVADGDKTSHFVHGVDDEGFVCHSGVIFSESGQDMSDGERLIFFGNPESHKSTTFTALTYFII